MLLSGCDTALNALARAGVNVPGSIEGFVPAYCSEEMEAARLELVAAVLEDDGRAVTLLDAYLRAVDQICP